MATVGESSREARRRRILERGSERLALITGRIQSLPEAGTFSRNPFVIYSSRDKHITTNSSLPFQDSGKEASLDQILNKPVETLLHNRDKDTSKATRSVSSLGADEELSQVSSSIQSPLLDHQYERQSHRNLLTMGQICTAIAASENIRVHCSVAAAVLVILSYTGIPILSWHVVRSTILFRPLYLLLLTNISIVLARLIMGSQGPESRMAQTKRNSVPAFGGNGLVDLVGKALEAGLLMQNIVGALSMDFSIYAVVLICGLSLIRMLGW
ncbi:hypothetical protein ACJIZ3_004942 [Penstemon smallii]|uniref:Uncharacterized protein n=1 Tax=Penstemon smallii TaxID=265156 RepID=A0ABD3S3P5_9LAMI